MKTQLFPPGIVRATRNDPNHVYRRNAQELAPATLDSERRRVRAALTTEDPALVYDWRRGGIVLEVLLMSGAEYESDTPLIRNHSSYSVDSIVGTVVEHQVQKDELLGWLVFLRDVDAQCEATWRRVEQGALRRVSVGYDYGDGDYQTIAAGQSQTIGGRRFTAPSDRDLRVVTRWRLREVSLVVIPADPRAQVRNGTGHGDAPQSGHAGNGNASAVTPPQRSTQMKKFLQFLHKCGLASSVTTLDEAIQWAREGNLSAAQLREAAGYAAEDEIDFDVSQCRARSETGSGSGTRSGNEEPSPERQRSDSPTGRVEEPGASAQPLTDAAAVARQEVERERQRQAAIRDLASRHSAVVTDEMVRTACDQGTSLDAFRDQVLEATERRREQFGSAPAGHIRGSEQITLEVLQAALLTKSECGIDPDSAVLRSDLARSLARHRDLNIGWMCNVPERGDRRDRLERAFEIVDQRGLRNISLMRAADLLVELDSGQRAYDEADILERAFSSGNYTTVFGSVVHLMMMDSYMSTPNTYSQICRVTEVSDFREHKTADMGQVGRLRRQGYNGGQAKLLNIDDPVLNSVTVERYAGQMKITDQMIIDDTLGVTGFLPRELGSTCVDMIDDLAWAQVLNSANLDDGRARYNVTDGNLVTSAAIDEAAISSVGKALKGQKVGNRRIRVTEGIIAAGLSHSPTLRKWMMSATINEARNPHFGTYTPIEDTAIDLGVDDPAQDDLAIAATPNSLYAFAGGDDSKRSITVAFRRGTNRGPVTRRFVLDKGEWGVGWDVYMDMGAAFQRRIGTVRLDITG